MPCPSSPLESQLCFYSLLGFCVQIPLELNGWIKVIVEERAKEETEKNEAIAKGEI